MSKKKDLSKEEGDLIKDLSKEEGDLIEECTQEIYNLLYEKRVDSDIGIVSAMAAALRIAVSADDVDTLIGLADCMAKDRSDIQKIADVTLTEMKLYPKKTIH
tara:strand:- start:126 stop:434 length:309 start_codon:yes stop_codon:yes gene_type:complete